MTLGAVSEGAGHSPHFLSQGSGLPGTLGCWGDPGSLPHSFAPRPKAPTQWQCLEQTELVVTASLGKEAPSEREATQGHGLLQSLTPRPQQTLSTARPRGRSPEPPRERPVRLGPAARLTLSGSPQNTGRHDRGENNVKGQNGAQNETAV